MKNKTAKTFFRHLQLIALFSFFLSCTGDENTENVTIEGRWYHYQVSVNNGTFQNYNHITNCSKDYLEFLQNGIFKVVEHNDDGTCDENIQNGTWDLNSNSLLITINSINTPAEILQLDSQTLKYQYTDEETLDDIIVVFKRN